MGVCNYQVGDWVVYRKTKRSEQPGPRAKNVWATPHGDGYAYTVDKFWIVAEILQSEQLRLRTRLGKEHVVAADDPHLHRARWLEKLLHRQRFRAVANGDEKKC